MPDDEALLRLAAWLQRADYRFVTVTPATHARVNARLGAGEARSLPDIFGWSRPFRPSLLPKHVLDWLERGGALEYGTGFVRSKVRFSTLGDALFMHSAYPTTDADAVFFGPDTYRFAALIERTLTDPGAARIASVVDVGCGAGVGGIIAAQALQSTQLQLILADINPVALRFARVNAALAATPGASFRQGDLFQVLDQPVDLIVANPPYLLDPDARLYRHGGGELGCGLSARIVMEGLPHLAAGGMMILYTGAAVVDGRDAFRQSVVPFLTAAGVCFDYKELDPDVFGEELENPAYAQADRIAAIALVIRVPRATAAGADRRAGHS